MLYVLYGHDRSGSCIVEAALAETGADYKRHNVDIRTDAQRDAEYAAVNPQRKLPTLVTPAGEIITESTAIVLTLAERHPDAGLLPPVPSPERARALRWMMFVATELYPIVEINDYPERFSPDPESKVAVREIAREIWRQRWLHVEAELADGPFLAEETFSITDVYIAVVSRWAQQGKWRPDNIPKIERLAAAVAGRPNLRDIWQRHFGKR